MNRTNKMNNEQHRRTFIEQHEPRNCDTFGGDFKMLHTAWFDWTGSPSGQNADGTAKMSFAEWLLAPVQKGGAK